MSAQLLGAHMPTAGGLGNAIRKGHEIGCAAIQVFTSNPQQWRAKEVTSEMVLEFLSACNETGISDVISHDSYLVNITSLEEDVRDRSYKYLKGEMNRCAQYGIDHVVSHIGSSKGQTLAQALASAAEVILNLFEETPPEVTLLMETTAGQGSDLNSKFEEIATILDLCHGHQRLGVCLDTCHVFAAGYDIRTSETYHKTFDLFDKLVGVGRIKAIHSNDSKRLLGSTIDRHAHIGEGEIGELAFRLLVNDPRFDNIPILLETKEPETMHPINLGRLKAMRES